MRKKTFAWIFAGGAVVASSVCGLVACSSDSTPINNFGPDSSVKDSGGGGDTSMPDTGMMGNDSGGGDGGGGCTTPPMLYPPSDAGVYCPYSKTGDAGSLHCKPQSEVCCIQPVNDAGTSDPSTCQTGTCSTGTAWACSSPVECGGGSNVCCLVAGPLEADPKCSGFQKTKGFAGTSCKAAASECMGTVMVGKYTDNQYIVCEQPSDCTTGTCTAVKTTGTSIGLCL